MYTDYSYLTTSADMSDASYAALGGLVGGALAGVMMTVSLISLVIGILTLIANWKLFNKAGQAGWKCLIPIYNVVILFKVAGISPLWILVYFASVIPFVGWVATLAVTIYLMISLAKAFGKSGGFAVGLILLNTIFIMILAFGDAKYQLGNNVDNNSSSPIEPQSL